MNPKVFEETFEEAIERLKEYRTVLISATVTGKIDVRQDPQAQTEEL